MRWIAMGLIILTILGCETTQTVRAKARQPLGRDVEWEITVEVVGQ